MTTGIPHRRSSLPITSLIHTANRSASPPPSVPNATPLSLTRTPHVPPPSPSPTIFRRHSMPPMQHISLSSCSLPDLFLPPSSTTLPSTPSPRITGSISVSSLSSHCTHIPQAQPFSRLCAPSTTMRTISRRLKPQRTIQSPRTERVQKNPWTPAETAQLATLIAHFGPGQWAKIASHIPGRSGKQVRERWKNHLDPTLKKSTWTADEDDVILRLHEKVGKKWSTIARELPGRSDNNVKNRFYCSLRPRVLRSARSKGEDFDKSYEERGSPYY